MILGGLPEQLLQRLDPAAEHRGKLARLVIENLADGVGMLAQGGVDLRRAGDERIRHIAPTRIEIDGNAVEPADHMLLEAADAVIERIGNFERASAEHLIDLVRAGRKCLGDFQSAAAERQIELGRLGGQRIRERQRSGWREAARSR